jgi:hypothetical protein
LAIFIIKECGDEKSLNLSTLLVFFRAQFKVDERLAFIRIFLERDILSGVVDPAFADGADGAVSEHMTIEGDGHMLIGGVVSASEAAEVELDIEVVLPAVDDLGVDEVQDVLVVADAGPIVLPLDFVEGGVAPFTLAAGVDFSVAAGD